MRDQNLTQKRQVFYMDCTACKKFDAWPRFGIVPSIWSVLNQNSSRVCSLDQYAKEKLLFVMIFSRFFSDLFDGAMLILFLEACSLIERALRSSMEHVS